MLEEYTSSKLFKGQIKHPFRNIVKEAITSISNY